jgi:hypothetical protein
VRKKSPGERLMELWAILLISGTFGFFLILGTVLVVKSRRGVPNMTSENIPIENTLVFQVENGYMDAISSYLTDSSIDENVPLDQVAKTLRRCNSVKYKDNINIKNCKKTDDELKDCGLVQEYKAIDHLKRFNTLQTPPSTPLKRPVIKSGSLSSIETCSSFDNLEEIFSHKVSNIPKSSQQLDRAQAVAFLKTKMEQRSLQSYSTPPRGLMGKKLERIPTNEI